MIFFQLSRRILRQIQASVTEPCITIVNGFFSVVKDDLLVAIDKTTGEISNENPFKPFDWPGTTFQLGKKIRLSSAQFAIGFPSNFILFAQFSNA